MSEALPHEAGEPGLTAKLTLPVILLMAGFLLAGAFTREPHSLLADVAGIAIALPATYLGTRPGVGWGAGWLLVAAAGVICVTGGRGASIAWFGFCVIAVSAVPCAGPRIGGAVIAALAAVLLYKLCDDGFRSFGWLPWIGGLTISSAGGALYAHEWAMLSRLRAAQANLAERSRGEERARIARDLHDVIAHSLTVSLLHVSAARLAVTHDDRAEAVRALEEAERLGRESLDEVRSIVGLMRGPADGEDSRFAPTPGIEGIGELVERFRTAGVDVCFDRDGSLQGSVAATVGTTAYRITQEALTNAAKHAPGAAVAVRLRAVDADRLELCVDSAGAGGPVGAGSGLTSMRERAEAVGGRLAAAPQQLESGPGWRVLAELPTGGAPWRS